MFSTMNERFDCERKVLSTLLLEGKTALGRLPAFFDFDCFEDRDYRKIFSAIKTLAKKESDVDLVHVAECLPKFAELLVDITSTAVILKNDLTSEAEKLFTHNLTPENGSAPGSSNILTFMDGKQMVELSKTLPPAKDLLKHIFREKSLNFLAGEAGCGKSIFAMNLALSVAVGAEKFLCWNIGIKGRVLFLNFELFSQDFMNRLQKMSERLPAPGDISNLLSPLQISSLEECWQQLNEFIAKEKPCLIIIDCLYYAHNEDESDNSRMKDIVRKLQSLRDKYNLCVLVVHHTKKGVQSTRLHTDLMRGAGVFGAAADTVLMIKRSQIKPSVRIVKATKLRHSADEELNARAMSLNEFLWFGDDGTTTEEEHMAPSIESNQPNWKNPNTIHAQLLKTVHSLRQCARNGLLTNSTIAHAYNVCRFGAEKLSPKKIVGILRELGFEPTTGQEGGIAIFWNEGLLEQRFKEFGIPYNSPTSETRESSESSETSPPSEQMDGSKSSEDSVHLQKREDSEVSELSEVSEGNNESAKTSPIGFGKTLQNPKGPLGEKIKEDQTRPFDPNEYSQRPDLNRIKAQVLSTIQNLRPADQDGHLTYTQVTDAYNLSRPKPEHITKEELGWLFVWMNLRTTTDQRGDKVLIWEEFSVELCCKEYGVPYSKPPLQSPSKAERERV